MKKNSMKKAGSVLLAAALSVGMTTAAFAGMGNGAGRNGFGGSSAGYSVSSSQNGAGMQNETGSQNQAGGLKKNGVQNESGTQNAAGAQNRTDAQNQAGAGVQEGSESTGSSGEQTGTGTQNNESPETRRNPEEMTQNGETLPAESASSAAAENAPAKPAAENESVPESKAEAPAVNADGQAVDSASGTNSLESLIRSFIDAILNVLRGSSGSTENAQELQQTSAENRQNIQKAGEDTAEISNAVASVEDADTKSSLEALLAAYTDALDAEKTALDDNTAGTDTLASLRSAVQSAREALMNALKDAGISLKMPELPERATPADMAETDAA